MGVTMKRVKPVFRCVPLEVLNVRMRVKHLGRNKVAGNLSREVIRNL
jgi:hypothetical protein